jgi:hypothetical protein
VRTRDAVLPSPKVEDGVRRAFAEVGVVDGAAADSPPLKHADRHVLGRAAARVLKQDGEHPVFTLVEVT